MRVFGASEECAHAATFVIIARSSASSASTFSRNLPGPMTNFASACGRAARRITICNSPETPGDTKQKSHHAAR